MKSWRLTSRWCSPWLHEFEAKHVFVFGEPIAKQTSCIGKRFLSERKTCGHWYFICSDDPNYIISSSYYLLYTHSVWTCIQCVHIHVAFAIVSVCANMAWRGNSDQTSQKQSASHTSRIRAAKSLYTVDVEKVYTRNGHSDHWFAQDHHTHTYIIIYIHVSFVFSRNGALQQSSVVEFVFGCVLSQIHNDIMC